MADSDPPLPPISDGPAPIRIGDVSHEFRHLVGRRRELLTLVGSIFAGLGVLLSNAMEGKLPDELGAIRDHLFASYAVLLMVPCVLIAVRMARLHGGMVLNGILFARLVEGQPFARGWTVTGARRHNLLGVSSLQVVLVSWLAGFSTMLLALTLNAHLAWAGGTGVGMIVAILGIYARFHRQAVRFADRQIATHPFGPPTEAEWREHLSGSLSDANDQMTGDVAFVGLMVFSVFETLAAFGKIVPGASDVATVDVRRFGPTAFVILMAVTCLMGLVSHARVRLALGRFSILLDPTDRPFRPFALTDSLLSFAILAFLFAVSIHLAQGLASPGPVARFVAVDLAVFVAVIAAHQAVLALMGRRLTRRSTPR